MGAWLLAALLLAAQPVAPAAARAVAPVSDEDGERYRALGAALERGDFAGARELAAGFLPDSPFARKAGLLAELGAFLAGEAGPPAPEPGAAAHHSGALRLALASDGAFSAALCPEAGPGGYRPLLFGWPRAWTSRVSLSIDGEAVMLSPRGAPYGTGDGLALAAREGDVEISLVLRGRAGAVGDPAVEAGTSVRIEATATNRGGVAHAVGVRLLLDLADGFSDAPVVGRGTREVLATSEDFAGEAVPRALAVGPGRRVVLRGLGTPGVERAVLAPLARALAAPFDFAVPNGEPLGPDSVLAVYLEPVALAPGEARLLAAELAGAGEERDAAPPVATEAWTEPVAGAPDLVRVVFALENAARGAAGPVEDLRVAARPGPGLVLVSAPADLAHLGTLAPGGIAQRVLLLRCTFERGGPYEVAFDVSARAGAGRAERTLAVPLPGPPTPAISGRILDVQGRPVAGAEVVLRRDGREVARTLAGGDGGYAFGGVAPAPHEVLARCVVHREPAAKTGREELENLLYDVVLTSETIGNDARPVLPVVLPGPGRDVVLARSLTRYTIFVSVEWDAPRVYLESIVRGMRRAAEFLYVASDGQLTYHRVIVADAAENWTSADLYDWTNNSVHPNADVAGMRHRYDPVHAPWNTAMNFGRQWDATWDSHGLFCTVVHEFGHYGLGLFDEYLGAPQGAFRGLAYWEMCRCIMGYQYADHKICGDANHHAYTAQGMWNGRSCWRQVEEWHEGLRGGFYAPITTPMERGGVVPPDFSSSIGEEVVAVIHDHDTGAFDATLQLAGPFGTALGGALVYTDLPAEGRTMYQGVTWANGQMQLMGVHAGDRVRGLKDGARAELVIGARQSGYTLEFGSEPAADRGPPPLVLVRAEHAGGARLGASVELLPLIPLAGRPVLARFDAAGSAIELEPREVDGRERFVGFLPASALPAGRASFETVLPDAVRGDLTLVTDAVLVELPAAIETELHSFDGSLRLRIPAGALAAPVPFCIASTAGPPLVLADAGSVGRLHGLLPSAEGSPFAGPILLAVRLDPGLDPGRVEIRGLDPATGEPILLPAFPSPADDELLVELAAPAVVGVFERR
ncbi:MAG: carboxypeptidase regulatory-like domain-containing protein [Planctomycetota bacterium]